MFKSKIKKFLIYGFFSFLISSFLIVFYIFFPSLLDSFDNRIRDSYFIFKGETKTSNNVVIIDIDDISIKEFGQWPWSRNILSKIIENLTNSNIAVVGMDIVFAEEDRTSPSLIAKKLGINKELENYDFEFAQVISKSAVILGYSFNIEDNNSSKNSPQIPAIFIEKNKNSDANYLIEAFGTTLNLPILQENSYSSGFFNIIPDESGVIRSVPLLISYNDTLYPSLALEIIRALNDTQKVFVNYDENGVSNIQLGDFYIPTDKFGRIFINYRGASKSFQYISAKDIYNNNFKAEDIEGKIALLGTSATGLYDLRATPYENVFPGVEVHANVIDNILQGDFLQKASYLDGVNIVSIFVLAFFAFFLVSVTPFLLKPFVFLLFFSLYVVFSYHALFSYGLVLNIIFPLSSIVLAFVFSIIIDFFYNIKQEKAIKNKFASKVSKSVMDDILKNIDNNEFSAKNKEITIFFSDIRGFTQISEQLKAKELIEYLNAYMEPMSSIIIKNQGTIDKFIGDAIMAYWNAPLDVENHADMAVKASLEQLVALDELNRKFVKDKLPTIDIGIGLNTGEVIVGEMGSSLRSDYTVIGDAINLGSRVESLCKYYGSKLNITNFTKDKLKEKYILRFLDFVRVKGKNQPVEIWQVIGTGEAQDELKDELEDYHKAIEFYKESNFSDALELFIKLENLENKTNKNIYKIYIKRCEEFIKTPPKDFDGVYLHTTKA
ncbi:adenylate/guanylate cyclase domain-containing protein [Aliarcobacter cryaerophilus ATCC 43158]|uniref:CHASE2 sensor-containing adenylate/guanylate cyclase n=1 Tax=Aliarcobacter cryaerophilus ATCC 43158 TaxID=1032070 RepID=A0AAD0XA66_9BACT|nr:adenylate/guanylate cyclase domain-containing protein [Aliarcobacter cryaerophilus]AYJ80047.1 CHASE2 sensor-containing adenylate/guanylate cyclase [Aliarcobacter cryaerophilus ATCC 43158]PRM97662.1 adenylate/guanylate cyclase domain-containing protein [Aliarcobacter cryaerophilus]QCZ24273.1 adenylate/guanylate cyclase domain-containing protein [Aliarcobacter cryaerophilus ATCC 43158]